MSAKKDPCVDAYIANAAPFAQPILKHLRKVIRATVPEAEETMKWSCPFYVYHDQIFCSFAAFKAHAAFGLHHQGMEALLTKELGKTNDAMGLLGRITSLRDLPDDPTLARYLELSKSLHDSGQPRMTKREAKPLPPTPPALEAALKRNKRANAEWAKFGPGAKREYIEWVADAKRDETREQRIKTTLEWVAEGKTRNWKYKNC